MTERRRDHKPRDIFGMDFSVVPADQLTGMSRAAQHTSASARSVAGLPGIFSQPVPITASHGLVPGAWRMVARWATRSGSARAFDTDWNHHGHDPLRGDVLCHSIRATARHPSDRGKECHGDVHATQNRTGSSRDQPFGGVQVVSFRGTLSASGCGSAPATRSGTCARAW